MCRDAGAKEVHLRISCPPTIGPCYYGIDTPRRDELIASQQVGRGDPEASSARTAVGYLSLEGMMRRSAASADSSARPAGPTTSRCRSRIEDEGQRRLFEKARR